MLSDSYVKEVDTDTARYLGRVLLMVCIQYTSQSYKPKNLPSQLVSN